jgi:acyl dehydratase
MDALYFEDFKPGDRFESAGKTLSEAEILDFAWRYDPQPIHMDKVAAEAGPYGGLIASGFQTLVTSFRLLWQTNLLDAASLGSPGIEELKWTKPVRPGDTLHTVIEVLETRPSSSKPDRGVCRIRWDGFNQHDDLVISFTTVNILARRPVAADEQPGDGS